MVAQDMLMLSVAFALLTIPRHGRRKSIATNQAMLEHGEHT